MDSSSKSIVPFPLYFWDHIYFLHDSIEYPYFNISFAGDIIAPLVIVINARCEEGKEPISIDGRHPLRVLE
jgi:hypothetical protein